MPDGLIALWALAQPAHHTASVLMTITMEEPSSGIGDHKTLVSFTRLHQCEIGWLTD